MKRVIVPALAAVFAAAAPAMAADTKAATDKPAAETAAPAGPEGAAGQTSDRTPQKDTPTPLSQTDKTTNVPVGADSQKPGTTSDRTPEAHKAMDKESKARGMKTDSGTETKTE